MSILDFFKKESPEELELKRRHYLTKFGRIADGTVIDTEPTAEGEIIYYSYSVHGADYESSEIVSKERVNDQLKYAPGARVGVRYDPKQHANSILE